MSDPLAGIAEAQQWPTSNWDVICQQTGRPGRVTISVQARTPYEAVQEAARQMGEQSLVAAPPRDHPVAQLPKRTACCCHYDPPGLRCYSCVMDHHDKCMDRRVVR